MLRSFKYILTVLAILLASHSYAQKVTLSERGASIEKIFEKIRKQTGYDFIYNSRMIKGANKVTINVSNADLTTVLGICFADQPFTYTITDKTIVVKLKDEPKKTDNGFFPSPIDVRGKVLNEKGEPVTGATVQVKGTSIKSATDEEGHFTLKGIENNVTLIISHVTIETLELKLNGNTDIAVNVKTKITTGENITVEANTGYQKLKPNETTGSVVVVSNERLNQQTGPNIIERLNGVTNGMLFNTGKYNSTKQTTNPYTIRGLSTINGSIEPLIILDNFQYNGDINNINPDDVENITILKDAAATSIYGARGGNGVIVITTKKGKFNQKLQVDFNANLIVTEIPDFYYLPTMSSKDYIDAEQILFNNNYFDNAINAVPYNRPLTPAIEIYLRRRKGLISPIDSALQINALKQIDSRDDFRKYFYSNSISRQYSLSLKGGTTNLAWIISGSYNRAVSALGAESNRLNVRFNNTYKPIRNLEIALSAYYTNTSSQSGKPSPLGLGVRDAPYIRFADEFGSALAVTTNYRNSYTDTAGAGKLLNWKNYPLSDYGHDKNSIHNDAFITDIGLSYQLTKWLKIGLNYQSQRSWGLDEREADIQSYYARNLINTFTNLTTSNPDSIHPIPIGGIYSSFTSSAKSQNIRGQLNFNNTWGRSQLSGLIGGEIGENISGPARSSTIYGYSSDPLTRTVVNFKSNYPNYVNGSLSQIPGAPEIGRTLLKRFVSIYGNAAYVFNKKYSVSGSLRRDASNLFGLTTNDKWNPLWSVGASWELSKETFYQYSLIPFLKVRATWGYSGNVDLSKTALPIITYFTDPVTGFASGVISPLSNPSLRWEKSRQLNIGLDFRTHKNISGSIEYYQKKGTDLYAETPYDYTTYGYTFTIPRNVADMVGHGLDIDLNFPVLKKAVKWDLNLIFNYNTAKTTRYFTDAAIQGQALLGSGDVISPVIGKPLYAIAAFKWGGLNSAGYPQGYLNGVLTTNYRLIMNENNTKGIYSDAIVYVGPANPTYFGSFINNIKWKGLSMSVCLLYRLGYYFRKPTLSMQSFIQSGIGHKDYSSRWQMPGDEFVTNVPVFNYPYISPAGFNTQGDQDAFYAASEINVLKADHIRLHYINLSYTLIRQAKSSKLKSCSLYMNVANMGILWRANKEKLDPDFPNSIPKSRSFTIGIRTSL